jgi:hypothetical protein
MAYPSTITTFITPLAGDTLNSPSHSSIEAAQNTGLTELQTYIGANTGASASIVGTLLYDIKAPDSDGGGHVQSGSKGGTGQTIFTKGDILVAPNSSTLSKLAVGSNNQYPIADTSEATGIKWGSPIRLGAAASVVTVTGNTDETTLFSVTVPTSVLSTANAVRATAYISAYTVAAAVDNLTLRATYGNNTIASVVLTASNASTPSIAGKIVFDLFGNADSSTQRGVVLVELKADRLNPLQNSVLGVDAFRRGTASVNSMSNQAIAVTAQWAASMVGSRLDMDSYVVEKIL